MLVTSREIDAVYGFTNLGTFQVVDYRSVIVLHPEGVFRYHGLKMSFGVCVGLIPCKECPYRVRCRGIKNGWL